MHLITLNLCSTIYTFERNSSAWSKHLDQSWESYNKLDFNNVFICRNDGWSDTAFIQIQRFTFLHLTILSCNCSEKGSQLWCDCHSKHEWRTAAPNSKPASTTSPYGWKITMRKQTKYATQRTQCNSELAKRCITHSPLKMSMSLTNLHKVNIKWLRPNMSKKNNKKHCSAVHS